MGCSWSVMNSSLTSDLRPQALSRAQRQFYAKNGYLILPDALTAKEASILLVDAQDIVADISRSGEGYPRCQSLDVELETPSPVGRILARYETGQSRPISTIVLHLLIGLLQPIIQRSSPTNDQYLA